MHADSQQAALDRARQGDTEALGELLNSFRPYVTAMAFSLRRGRLQARFGESDVVQDAMLDACRHFASFRGTTVAEFASWLQKLVTNVVWHKVRDHLGTDKRAIGREQALDGLSDVLTVHDSPSAEAMRHEQAATMAAALSRLPEDMRTVLLARHQDQLPHADIAQRLGRTEEAVRVLYLRAIRRLQEECSTTTPATRSIQ